MVEGLEGERTALVAKVHHAILDGVSGASVLAAFLDLTPRTRVASLPPEWDPAPLPSNTQMLRHAASSLARQPGSALSTLQAGVEAVADLGMHNRELAGRGEQSPPGFFAAPADVLQRRRLEPEALRRPVGPARGREAGRPGLRGDGERRDPGLRLGWAPPPAGDPRGGAGGVAGRHGAGLDACRRGDRGAGEPDLGDAGLAGQRRGGPGGPARRHLRVGAGGQGAGEAARGPLRRRPGPDRPARAGHPRGPRRGGDPAVRQDAAAVQRHGLERAGARLPAVPGREPRGRHVPGRAPWPRASGST